MVLKLRLYLCIVIIKKNFLKKCDNINKLPKMEKYSHHINVRHQSYVFINTYDNLTSMFILWNKNVA